VKDLIRNRFQRQSETEERVEIKLKSARVLSIKLQHPISKETSIFKIPKKPTHDQLLELDVWSFFACWSLEFGSFG
jgi:hypothetical protein